MKSSSRWLLSAAVLATLPARAGAQSLLTGSAVHVETPALTPSIFTAPQPLTVTESGLRTFTTGGTLTSGRWTVRSDTSWSTKDPQTQVSARAGFSAPGGWRISAGMTGRQSYAMPLAVVQALGSDGIVPDAAASFLDPMGHAMIWDSQIRVEKILKDRGKVHVRAVGEIFNLFDTSKLAGGSANSLLTSRAVRVGLVLGF